VVHASAVFAASSPAQYSSTKRGTSEAMSLSYVVFPKCFFSTFALSR
jgi:hypothetical protein